MISTVSDRTQGCNKFQLLFLLVIFLSLSIFMCKTRLNTVVHLISSFDVCFLPSRSRWYQWQPKATSQCVCHSLHFISSCRHFLISHHNKKVKYSTVSYFERDQIHIPFVIVYCHNCSILLLVIAVNIFTEPNL